MKKKIAFKNNHSNFFYIHFQTSNYNRITPTWMDFSRCWQLVRSRPSGQVNRSGSGGSGGGSLDRRLLPLGVLAGRQGGRHHEQQEKSWEAPHS
ncbi:hypothetical protein TNIN_216901 [Trichonephila inaurata madagascariensis]|uniref:Uncharacterized protein n=1 Tax=Trichonephila inaurata madagascariensis TaxID=2747483 RepID=A0A8X6X4W7_9ARAC|nr:hypothetical protein TNIN_216901 [Trichonephila inaurata madagascariensis]